MSCSKPAIRQNSRGMLSIVEKYGGGITARTDSIPHGRMLSGCGVILWDQVFIMVVYREKETAFCFMKRGLGTRHSSMIYTLKSKISGCLACRATFHRRCLGSSIQGTGSCFPADLHTANLVDTRMPWGQGSVTRKENIQEKSEIRKRLFTGNVIIREENETGFIRTMLDEEQKLLFLGGDVIGRCFRFFVPMKSERRRKFCLWK